MLRNALHCCAVFAVIAVWLTGSARRVDADDQAEEIIRADARKYIQAFNDRDAKAIGALWAEDGDYIDASGVVYSGRKAIVDEYRRYFAGSKGRTVRLFIESIRFVTPDVAIVDGVSEVDPPPEGPPVMGRYSSLRVKRDGHWRIAAVRESAEQIPSNYEHLQELQWMVGTWLDQDEDISIRTTARWSRNKNFLIRDFAVKMADRPVLSGTQRVGWDPVRQQIKSWVFDSEGGVGQGLWVRDGNRWIIRKTALLQDGTKASSTSIVTMIDDDSFTWQSRNRVVGDETLPDLPEVNVVRLPPDPM